jgi:hypothetical protein
MLPDKVMKNLRSILAEMLRNIHFSTISAERSRGVHNPSKLFSSTK